MPATLNSVTDFDTQAVPPGAEVPFEKVVNSLQAGTRPAGTLRSAPLRRQIPVRHQADYYKKGCTLAVASLFYLSKIILYHQNCDKMYFIYQKCIKATKDELHFPH